MAVKKRTLGDDLREYKRRQSRELSSSNDTNDGRTLGDDLRDYRAGKIENRYYNNIKSPYQNINSKTTAYSDLMENDINKSKIQEYEVETDSDGKVKGLVPVENNTQTSSKESSTNDSKSTLKIPDNLSENPFREQYVKDLINRQKTSGATVYLNTDEYLKYKNDESNPYADRIFLNPQIVADEYNKLKDEEYYSENKEDSTKLITADNVIKASKPKHITADDVKNEYNTILKYNEIVKKEAKYKALEEKYKSMPLEQRQKAIENIEDENEKEWLKNNLYESMSVEEINKYIKILDDEYESLFNSGAGIDKDKRREEIESEISLLEDEILPEKNEKEKANKYYYDIVNNDPDGAEILSKYYELKDYEDKMGSSVPDEASAYSKEMESISPEAVKKIKEDFNSFSQGYDADELFKYYSRYREVEENKQKLAEDAEWAKNNGFLATVQTTLAKPFDSFSTLFQQGSALIHKSLGDDGYYNPEASALYHNTNKQSAVAQSIDNEFLQGAYNIGLSVADNSSRMALNAIPYVGPALHAMVLSAEVGAQSINDTVENGGSLEQAFATGIAQTAVEFLTEKFSIEKMKAFKPKDAVTLKNALLNVGKSVGVEASEEGIANIADTIIDDIINGDKSQYNTNIKNYIEQGYSQNEASSLAWKDYINGLVFDTVAGGISGGLFGGFNNTIAYFVNNKSSSELGREISADDNFDINLLIKSGLEVENKSSSAYKIASKLDKLTASKISDADIGNLCKAIMIESVNSSSDNLNVEDTNKKTAVKKQQSTPAPKNTSVKTKINAVNKQQSTSAPVSTSQNAKIKVYAFGKSNPNGVTAKDKNGNTVFIKNVEQSAAKYGESDNTVVFNLVNGGTVKADEITFSDQKFEELKKNSSSFNTMGARSFISNYELYEENCAKNGIKPDTFAYWNDFERMYTIGRSGASFETVLKTDRYKAHLQNLGKNVARNAYDAGRNDSNSLVQHRANKLLEVVNKNGKAENINAKVYLENGTITNIESEIMQALQQLASKTGRDIVITDRLGDKENGMYKGGRLYISSEIDSHKALTVALHEAGHSIKESNPAEFKVLSDFIIDYLTLNGHNVDQMIDNVIKAYGNKLVATESESIKDLALEEVICNTLMSLASDEQALAKAIENTDKSKLKKISDVIKKIAAKIKSYFDGLKSNYAAKAFVKDIDALNKLAEMFSVAADNAKNNIVDTETYQNGKAVEAVKYSVDNSKITSDEISEIQNIGGNGVAISVNDFSSSDIKKAEKVAARIYNRLGENGTKSPFFRAWFGDWRLDDKTKITVANKKGNSRGLQSNTDTGWNINISSKIFNETNSHNSNSIKTAVPFLEYINDIIKNAILLDTYSLGKTKSQNSLFMHSFYAVADIGNGQEVLKLFVEEMYDPNSTDNNNRAYQLQNIEKYQSAVIGSQSNAASLISQTGSIDTISNLANYVKSKDKNYNPKSVNQDLLDDEGKPLVVYHGTDTDFTVFDPSKGRANMDIQGMFFSPWKLDAQGYGSKVGAYYLNIKNPAPEHIAYKALNKFAGQNYAGVKARNYLEKLGYDSVNNNDEEYIAFYPTQIKSATDNIGTFDRTNSDVRYSIDIEENDISDIRYAIDDAYNDVFMEVDTDLFEDESRIADIEEIIKENPDTAITLIYKAAAKTAVQGITAGRGIELDEQGLDKVVNKVMKNYQIDKKLNPNYADELKENITRFVNDIYNDKASFADLFSEFVTDCKDGIMLSGELDYSAMQEERDFVKDLTYGKTLLITDYQESQIKENYGSVSNFRKHMFGKTYVALERNRSSSGGYYVDDILAHVEEKFPNLINDRLNDSLGGIEWLDNLLNNVLAPKYVNHYVDGFYENADVAAVEMAFNCIGEYIQQQGLQYVNDSKADKKTIREISKASKTVKSEYKALIKAKTESYNTQLEKQKEIIKDLRNKNKNLNDRNAKQRKIIMARTKTIKQQYYAEREKMTYIDRTKKLQKRMEQMVLNPNDKSYVPTGFGEVFIKTAEVLTDAINMNNGTMLSEHLQTVVNKLNSINSSEEHHGDFLNAFDESLIKKVDSLREHFQNKLDNRKINRAELTLSEITDLYNTMHEIYYTVKDATKQLAREENISNYESGCRVIEDMGNINKSINVLKNIEGQTLSAMRLAKMYTGYNDESELMYHMHALEIGTRKKEMFRMTAEKPITEFTDSHKKEFDKFKRDVITVEYEEFDGEKKTVKMTKSQGLQILMSWTREHQKYSKLSHIEKGGLTLLEPEILRKGNLRKAYDAKKTIKNITPSLIIGIEDQMGEFEKEYRRLAENLFNVVAKQYINETTRVLKHRDIATEEYYIPFSVNKDFVNSEIDGLKYDATIEGMGILKSTVIKAPQPLIISGLDQVIARHINDIGNLYGYAVPIRNFNKMWNVKQYVTDKNGQTVPSTSVKDSIQKAWKSNKPKEFFEQVIKDLQTSRQANNSTQDGINHMITQIRSNMITSSLTGSISVVIKQAASYSTAGSILSTASLSKAFGKYGTGRLLLPGQFEKICNEIDTYTATHYMRRIGLSSMEIAEIKEGFLNKHLPTAINPAKWIQGMDCLTTAVHWIACKEEISNSYKKGGIQDKIGSKDYFNDVANLYDEVIEQTQPMYDTLHRAEIQKNSSELIKSTIMFKTQPLQNTGIVYDSISECIAKHGKDGTVKKLSKALGSQIISAFTFAAMTYIGARALHKPDKYKDEDGEVNASSIFNRIMMDMGENLFSVAVPLGGSELVSLNQNIAGGKSYDILSDNVVDMVADFANTVASFYNTMSKTMSMAESEMPVNGERIVESIKELAVDALALFKGSAVKNYGNIIDGAWNYITDIIDNNDTFHHSNISNIISAKKSGDNSKADKISDKLLNDYMFEGKTEDQAHEALKNDLVTAFTKEDDIIQAAQAKLDGDFNTYQELVDKFAGYGFDKKDIVKAVKKLNKGKNNDESDSDESSEELGSVFDYSGKEKQGVVFTYSDLYEAYENGNTENYNTVYNYFINEVGKKPEDINKALKSYITRKEKEENN